MRDDSLTIMIAPGHAGGAWRHALMRRAVDLGWPVADLGPEGPPEGGKGLFVAHDAQAMASSRGHRVVLIDTSAGGTADPSEIATPDEIVMRSRALALAEEAARHGATVLNAARYHLELPGLGLVERPNGDPYRIHPAAAESPLALYDTLPVEAGTSASWAPHWFVYSDGYKLPHSPAWVDMTGRMRPLVFGPYIYLPAGRWRTDVSFSVDPERGHAPLLFEWGAGADYCRVMFEIRHPGTYGIHLDRIWPTPDSAQLRIWNAHPVFQGKIELQSCRVTRVADDDPSPPTRLDQIVELGVI